jgi:uncharacterized protein (TIGR02453 family)
VSPQADSFAGIPDAALDFYDGLEADNSKTYWTRHKDVYDECVRVPMQALLAELEDEFGPSQVFRPYRDVRFSKDKSPYKTHQGAFVEVEDGVGYYVQVSAAGLLVAAGWHPKGKQILRFRDAVLAPAGSELEQLLTTLERTGFAVRGDRLASRPRGQAPGHPRESLTRFKTLEVTREYGAPAWLRRREAVDRVRADWTTLRPLVQWLVPNVGPGSDT